MTAPAQTTAPAVQEVAPAACTAAAAPLPDAAHVTPEAAAASAKDFKANKKCPCPNCRPPAPAPAAAGNAGAAKGATKGVGSFAANVKRGGEGDMVWQLGKSAAQQGRKQQQQQQHGGKAAGGKAGGKGGKGGKQQFDVKALPAKPLMAAPTSKQVTEAKASFGFEDDEVGQHWCATGTPERLQHVRQLPAWCMMPPAAHPACRLPSTQLMLMRAHAHAPPVWLLPHSLPCSPSPRSPRRASR